MHKVDYMTPSAPAKQKLVAVARIRDEIELLPWLLANLTYADVIMLVDGGSRDGSWEWMKEREESGRLEVYRLPKAGAPYHDETRHMRMCFQLALAERANWVCYHDADELWNVALQENVRAIAAREVQPRTGIAFQDYELAAGWKTYYPEVSGPLLRLWNWEPEDLPDRGYPFAFAPPTYVVRASGENIIYHVNWACEERFARKRKWYSEWKGYASWHPDEKFGVKLPVEVSDIYSPDGSRVAITELGKCLR